MKTEMNLRPAEEKDCRLLWKWRNEKNTRRTSFNSKYIPYEEHKKWFEKKIKSKNSKIFIVQDNHNRKIGMIRFDINSGDKAEINIIIDRNKRGRGYGTKALRLSSEYAFKNLSVRKIIAHIKKENISSLKSFSKAGFINKGFKKIKSFISYEMFLKRNN